MVPDRILVMQLCSLPPVTLFTYISLYKMAPKRKREEEKDVDSVFRPPAGTRSYETGQSVKEGLASGSRQGELPDCSMRDGVDGQLSWLSTSRSILIGPNFL
jgi:hypothetical protein